MKKLISVKQKHRYTKETNLMYRGLSEYENRRNEIILHYKETSSGAHVELSAKNEEMLLTRKSDSITSLRFIEGKTTKGSVSNEYGELSVDIYTHKYRKYENVIVVEYDVVNNNEVSDGYRILWKMKDAA
ncbi:MAG: DUF1934 domain-containing protein [Erysipelotrichaceae bacterium]